MSEIGPRRQQPETAFWMSVVAHAKANPGVWIPLIDPPQSKRTLQNIAGQMKNQRNSDAVPVPMQQWGMKAQVVKGVFHFRFDDLPLVQVVQSGGQLWPNEYNPQERQAQ